AADVEVDVEGPQLTREVGVELVGERRQRTSGGPSGRRCAPRKVDVPDALRTGDQRERADRAVVDRPDKPFLFAHVTASGPRARAIVPARRLEAMHLRRWSGRKREIASYQTGFLAGWSG